MPNQRAKNKVRLGGFIDLGIYREVVRQARMEGMADNKFGFTIKVIEEALGRYRAPTPRASARAPRRRASSSRKS